SAPDATSLMPASESSKRKRAKFARIAWFGVTPTYPDTPTEPQSHVHGMFTATAMEPAPASDVVGVVGLSASAAANRGANASRATRNRRRRIPTCSCRSEARPRTRLSSRFFDALVWICDRRLTPVSAAQPKLFAHAEPTIDVDRLAAFGREAPCER